jgi:hypothetical protein
MMRGGAVVIRMISGKTPVTNLPQRAVIFVMIGQVLVTFEAVWKGSGGPGLLTLLTRKEVNALLQNCPTFKAVATIFVDPF